MFKHLSYDHDMTLEEIKQLFYSNLADFKDNALTWNDMVLMNCLEQVFIFQEKLTQWGAPFDELEMIQQWLERFDHGHITLWPF